MKTLEAVDEEQRSRGVPPENVAALKQWLALRRSVHGSIPKSDKQSERLFMVKPPGFNAFGIFIRGDSTLGAERLERFVSTGCRMISLREGLLAWRYSAAFRRFICSRDEEGMWSSKNHMWVSGNGLTEDGGYEIEADGSIMPVSQKLYDRLPSRTRVAFREGSGNVELIGGKTGRRIHLSVQTDKFEGTDMNDHCWLAYTKGI